MKKYIFLACALALATGFTSCSTDPADATSKHVYADNENVSLNTSAGVWRTENKEFNVGSKEVFSIDLSMYDADFKSQLGVSAAEAVKAVEAGTLDMYIIRASKMQWYKTDKNYKTGWYINTSNISCDEKDAVAKMWVEGTNLNIQLADNAPLGTSLDLNVGFGKKSEYGTYEKYVRIGSNVTVSDMSVILASTSIGIMADDYAYWELFFEENYDDQFMSCLGMTAQQALDGVEAGTVGFYITDADGKYDSNQTYTANDEAGYHGYWLNADAKICNWGDGSVIAAIAEMGERAIWFSVYPGTAPRTIKINCIFVLKSDPSKTIRVITNCTLN